MKLVISVDGDTPIRAIDLVRRVAGRYPGNDQALLQIELPNVTLGSRLPDVDYWDPRLLADLERVLGTAEVEWHEPDE